MSHLRYAKPELCWYPMQMDPLKNWPPLWENHGKTMYKIMSSATAAFRRCHGCRVTRAPCPFDLDASLAQWPVGAAKQQKLGEFGLQQRLTVVDNG